MDPLGTLGGQLGTEGRHPECCADFYLASKLLERITLARNSILDRIEITLTNPSPGEQRAIDEALRTLRRLAETASKSERSLTFFSISRCD